MGTTPNIEDKLLDKASKLTGIKEKTSLVRLGPEALIARESRDLPRLVTQKRNWRWSPADSQQIRKWFLF